MEQSSTISDGRATLDVQKIWEICLDSRTGGALDELEMRERQAGIADPGERCEEPRLALAGNALSWTMHCARQQPAGKMAEKTEVRHTTTFVSGDETRAETLVSGHDRFVTLMKRTGICKHGLKPGEMTLMHWRVNGEETLKARERRNLYREIEKYKAITASRTRK